ncbi:MAG TPA: hypothetical protein V6D11_18130 [Waterburya sp.]|jgi:Spy/CpxP family protein refolding chaperone
MKIKLMPMLAGAIALGVVATPFAVKAQAHHSGQPLLAQAQRQEHQGKWAKLNLTDAQKEQMRQIKKDTHNQIQSILTQEQQDKLKTLMQNRRGQNRQGQNQQGQNRQARRNVMAELNLTDDQKAKIKQIMEQQKARMQAVLTAEQQQQLQQMRQNWQQQRQQRQQGNQ